MKRFLIISFLLGMTAMYTHVVEAQLITDSDRRLKTEKKEKKGFLFGLFSRDKKAAPKQSTTPFKSFERRPVQPRYSQVDPGSLFRSKRTAPVAYPSGPPSFSDVFRGPPRYSAGSPFRNKKYGTYPRYSLGKPFDRQSMSVPAPRSISGIEPFSKKDRLVAPRYSAGPPWDNKRISVVPRSISGRPPFTRKDLTVNPRYSSGNPFSNARYNVYPRYSGGMPFTKRDMQADPPRYSSPLRFTNKDMAVNPRYSSPLQFTRKDMQVNPRYSQPLRFTKRDMRVNPRYSQPLQFSRRDMKVNPRYSSPLQFTRRDMKVDPRYSKDIHQKWDRKVNPRYSAGLEFTRKDMKVDTRYSKEKDLTVRKKDINPRYSTYANRFEWKDEKKYGVAESSDFKGDATKRLEWFRKLDDLSEDWKRSRFEGLKVPYLSKENFKDSSTDQGKYEGTFKEKWVNNHKMHPSFTHHRADQESELLRESLRKWNIFWVRLNGNNVQPDAVKEKVSEPKFDRKEAEIWND